MLRHPLLFGVLAGLAAVAPRQTAPMASIASAPSIAPSAAMSWVGSTRPMPAALRHRHDPLRIHQRRDDQSWDSENWSGYAVTGTNVTVASGSWVVPSVDCGAGSQYASFWVGIDGFGGDTVEQTGTDSDCQNGIPTYYAWFEFYPQGSFLINSRAIGTIEPGTLMSAEVSYAASTGSFTVTISNGNGGRFSTSTTMAASRASAEWIAEAPSSSSGELPLSDFGTVNFSASFATVNGVSGSIGSFLGSGCTSAACSSAVQLVTMSQSDGVGAQPSGLDSTGAEFSDVFVGPPPTPLPPPPPPPPPPSPKKKHGNGG
jgi:hypothetical protein